MSSIISDRYRLLKQLHAATHSQILIAKHRQSDTEVVIKVFEDGAANMCPKEVELLKKCEHPGIVPVFDAFPDTQTGWYCLVMPMVGRRAVDLFDYIEEYGPLQEEVIVTIFKQLLSAIIYLHKDQSVAHCDIKDENVVIEPDTLKVQLIDFGSARPVDDVVALEDITIAYAPPEVYNSQTATKLVAQSLDLWCLGVLLFTMMYSRSPFSSSYDAQACILNFDRSMHSTGTTVR